MGKKWSKEDIKFLVENYSKKSVKEISAILNRSSCSLHTYAKKLGISQLINKNIKYFDIPNLENSYWAGFIAADGCISRKDMVVIQLNYKDKSHLLKFAECCGYKGEVKDLITTTGYKIGSLTSIIRVSGVTNWVDKLKENWNIIPKKSLILEHPNNLSLENSLSFIKGYIDGDGCIRYDNGYLCISMIGTNNILSWIKDIFDTISIPGSRIANLHKSLNSEQSIYQIKGYRAEEIFKYLKNVRSPELERKWNSD